MGQSTSEGKSFAAQGASASRQKSMLPERVNTLPAMIITQTARNGSHDPPSLFRQLNRVIRSRVGETAPLGNQPLRGWSVAGKERVLFLP